MFKDSSQLRRLVTRKLRRLSVPGGNVLELGGRAGGVHATLFAEKGCRYVSAGYEGEVQVDIQRQPLPFSPATFDIVLVCMVFMYLDGKEGVMHALREAERVLVPGGRILLLEPFMCGETSHKDILDLNRWSMPGMERILKDSGFQGVQGEALGGVLGLGAAILRDLLPAPLMPVRILLTYLGMAADAMAVKIPYLRKRDKRYYHGYVMWASKE